MSWYGACAERGSDRRAAGARLLAVLTALVVGMSTFAASPPIASWPDAATVSPSKFVAIVEELAQRIKADRRDGLDRDVIEWLLTAEGGFRLRGVDVPGEADRFHLLGEALFRQAAYGEAVEWFLRAHDRCGMEEADWLWRHHGLRVPTFVQIVETGGPIPACGAIEHRSQATSEEFVAFRTGSVYRYDRRVRRHAVVFTSPDRSNWPQHLSREDQWLKILLKNGQRYRFDLKRYTLQELPRIGIQRSGRTGSTHLLYLGLDKLDRLC